MTVVINSGASVGGDYYLREFWVVPWGEANLGEANLGGPTTGCLQPQGVGDVPGPSSIQQVSCTHFESLDLFLDMIRNKCIYENSINIKWVNFSFLEWDTYS